LFLSAMTEYVVVKNGGVRKKRAGRGRKCESNVMKLCESSEYDA